MNELTAISPVDGRYKDKVKNLSNYFSEYALIKKRLFVEIEFLKELGKGDYSKVYDGFDLDEAKKVKDIEKKINHDVKAVEYYLKEKVKKEDREFVHFGLTSEDVTNLAYSLLIKEFVETEYYMTIQKLLDDLKDKSLKYIGTPLLARTHGQPASPTTFGKEFFVYYSRIKDQFSTIRTIRMKGKLNGATGNYNALQFVMPEVDWIDFSTKFITRLGLDVNLVTTQVEPKDKMVELFHCIKRINNIIQDLDKDMWMYISYNYLKLQKKDNEVGSSTMPHKVNPIDFENSEGNIRIANSLISGFEGLQISRMQRDLSDSTMLRNIGVMFSHSILSYKSAIKGLGKILPNINVIEKDLRENPEILTEAIQTILRRYKVKGAYEKLKAFSRGNKLSLERLRDFIDFLDIPKEEKERLKKLEPKDYIGLASQITGL